MALVLNEPVHDQNKIVQLTFYILFAVLQVTVSTSKTWPWFAHIPSLNCSGAIIHERWLLTSSNCFTKMTFPSQLLIQAQNYETTKRNEEDTVMVSVIDYVNSRKYDLAMLYLSQNPFTVNVITMRAKYANTPNSAVVVNWHSHHTNDAGYAERTYTLPVDIVSCIDKNISRLCMSFRGNSSYNVNEYCSRVNVGSPLIVFNEGGVISLVGVLQKKTVCGAQNNAIVGEFTYVYQDMEWIRKMFLIKGMWNCL